MMSSWTRKAETQKAQFRDNGEFIPALSDSATPSNLNASHFLTGKDNIMLNPIFGMLGSDPKHTRYARLSLTVIKLYAINIYEIAESGNTGLFQLQKWTHGKR